MSVRNRASMERYCTARPSGPISLAGWLLGVIGLGAVSFVIGFFVIAPMISSGRQAEAESQAGTPMALSNDTQNAASHAATTPAPPPPPLRSNPSRPVVSAPARPLPGPSIDPVNDDNTQPPGSPDTQAQGATPPTRTGASGDNTPAGATAPSKAAGPDDTAPTPHHRRRHRRSADADTVQPPATPDGESPANKPADTAPQTTAPTTSPDERRAGEGASPTPPAEGTFRVQLGVFSTREAAEQEAQDRKS